MEIRSFTRSFVNTRKGMALIAWALLVPAMLWITPWGDAQGGASVTALYVLGNLIKPEQFSPSAVAFLPRAVLINLAFLTNIVFLFSIWFRDSPAPSCGMFAILIGAVSIDAVVAIALHDFAQLIGYWLWLAAVVAIMWSFVARPPTGQAPPGYARAQLQALHNSSEKGVGLPFVLRCGIGWLVFWGVVTVASHWVGPTIIDAPQGNSQHARAEKLNRYVNDFASVITGTTVERIDHALAQFEKETSNQIAVAIYGPLPGVAVEGFTLSVAEQSRLGRKGLDNGAILSIFVQDKVARLEVGYGLEGVLTDAQSHRVLESVFVPSWNAGDRDKAVEETMNAVTALVRDAYQAQKMPGRLTVFWRQLVVEVPRFAKRVLPTLIALPTDARFCIALFGTFLIVGIWDGVVKTRALLGNAWRAAANFRAGRALFTGSEPVQIESIVDTLKVLLFAGFLFYLLLGIVVIAGGGAFGGAGSNLRW